MFITFYTPTYKRPQRLARCLESVSAQTAVEDIEHIIIADHVGVGVHGMYERLPQYVSAVHGDYVHLLADDDVLAEYDVVEQVRDFAREKNYPEMIQVRVVKGFVEFPLEPWGPPVLQRIDLGCIITRGDIWRKFAAEGAYPPKYDADFYFMKALWDAGHRWQFCDVRFLWGDVLRGVPEVFLEGSAASPIGSQAQGAA